MKKRPALIAVLLIALWSSCVVEQPFSGTSEILARFGLASTAAMDGKITIGEAYLKLDRIEVTGNLGGKSNPAATHSISPDDLPYRLGASDSSHVNFAVHSRAYDELDLHLFLRQEPYQLVFLHENVAEEQPEAPQPGGNGGNTNAGEGEEPEDDGVTDGSGDAGGHGDEPAGDNDHGDDKSEGEEDNEDNEDDKDDKDDEDDEGHKHDGDDSDDEGHKHDDDKDEDEDDRDDDDGKDDKGHKGDKDDKKDKDKDRGDDDDDDDGDDDRRFSSNAADRVIDLEHFFQNAKPGLVVFGVYENKGTVINLIFVATDVEKISVRGRQNDNASILLAAQNIAQVTFDPEKWFESLTPAEIESGSMQTYQQQTVLFIHPQYNGVLYEAIVSRLDQSANLNFSLPETAGAL